MTLRTLVSPLLATLFVSVLPIGTLLLLPRFINTTGRRRSSTKGGSESTSAKSFLMSLLLCFSAGSLVADALLHLLVQSTFGDFPSLDNAKRQMLIALGGLASFLFLDILLRKLQFTEPGELGSNNAVESFELPAAQDSANPSKLPTAASPSSVDYSHGARRRNRGAPSPTLKMVSTGRSSPSPERFVQGHCGRNSGLLSLIADGVHNFTDGLAIAASFSNSYSLGLSTSMAIMLHEIPHELGDYAILMRCGFKHERIILLQLLTAAGAFLGTLTGILIEGGPRAWLSVSPNGDALLPFAAGGFLYVALCSILPEVLADHHSRPAMRHALGQFLAFLAGVALMNLIE